MKRLLLPLILLLLAFKVQSQNLLTNPGFENSLTNWYGYFDTGNNYNGTRSASTTEFHSGNSSLQVQVTSINASDASYWDRLWHVQVNHSGFTITTNKIYKVGFWSKSDITGKNFSIEISKNASPWTIYNSAVFNTSTSWQFYEFSFVSSVTANDLRVNFNLGDAVGNYYIDDVSLTEEGTIDQNWYADAEKRIDTLRKGTFTFQVQDQSGQPLTACSVSVKLKQHDFPFGTAINLSTNINADETWYRTTAAKYFNCGVFENAFKWPEMEPTDGNVNYGTVDYTLNWAKSIGWKMRGHTFVWGGADPWETPNWLWSQPVPTVLQKVKRRIDRESAYFLNKIDEFDVLNEGIHETSFASFTGDSVNWLAFKWARAANPSATLFINDYNIIEAGETWKYKSFIQNLLNNGAPIDGIGIQGHFNNRINWQDVKFKLDVMGELGLPIKITEFDMNVNSIGMTQTDQANDYAKMLRIAFSHPDVSGFMFWGFWDSRHWINGAGLFDTSKNKKPAADSVYNLIHVKWNTDTTGVTDNQGKFSFRGFMGDYDVHCGCSNQDFVVKYLRSDADTTIQVVPASTQNISSQSFSVFPNPAQDQLTVKFKKFNKGTLTIYSATGSLVHQQKINSDQVLQLNISNLNSGNYIIRINAEDGSESVMFHKE